ncbi:acyl transferase domain-containing protein [Nocardiopsis sp. Huas11]|uniref:type I polyketide synthase n=1 Tax=Nocardiopsis sp. Huas11 TaxID=2183912 RepID=UPI000EAE1255|nr:type I polyketide synthase [Nocardiopsis sp. Huas11]RKS09661.1 acyl transferase domain-containing protein [Nocardiopsis sp. Huas11]
MTERTDQRALLERALLQLRDARGRLREAERARHEPIAVLGAGLRAPGGAADPEALWELLRTGADAVAPMTDAPDGRRPGADARRSGTPSDQDRWAGQLDEVDSFDAGFFGITPGEAARMDPQQRLVLETAWEAVEDAGLPVERLREGSTGVFLGVYGSDYLTMQVAGSAPINAYTAPGGAHSIVANRLSYLLDLHGPSLAVDTACSSSLMAVHLAVRALRQGDCDLALVGGVNVLLSPLSTEVTGRVLPLAPGGRCRSFDADADGIVRGEGCAVLLLGRASETGAVRPRGLIRGTAANHDGRTNGLTAPNPRAQASLLRAALADAAASPQEVVYVEAHGTGTPLGDPIEVEGLREVYGQGEHACALGSVKANFGHQEAAAGITGLVKALLVLEKGEAPPLPHLRRVNPEIDLEGTRFTIPTRPTPLAPAPRPLAAVSSFGFGGANAHAVLEAAPPADTGQAPDDQAADTAVPGRLVLALSARGEPALAALAARYADRLDGADLAEAERVCAAAALHRSHHAHRLCLTAESVDGLISRLRTAARRPAVPRPTTDRRVAFVFSGQGSQWAAMGAALLDREPVVLAEVREWDALVREAAGWSVLEQLRAPEETSRLHETEIAQVAIAALQLGLAALWRSWGVTPHAVVGHSMGEIVAAADAAMLTRVQAVDLLLRRARLTEKGARGGAMASVALPLSEVEPLVLGVDGVGVGAVNGPRSTVVSGTPEGVAAVVEAATAQGAATRRLPVEYGFHSPLLERQGAELAEEAAHVTASPGRADFYSTVTGTRLEAHALDGGHWGRNLREAVFFAPALTEVAATGIATFVEIGPHPVLLRDIGTLVEEAGVQGTTVGSLRRGKPLADSLDQSLARLYAHGADIDWAGVHPAPRDGADLPLYPWQRARHWLPEGTVPSVARSAEPAATDATAAPGVQRPSGAPAPASGEDLVATLERFVRERVANALNLESPDAVPRDALLADLALDSLVIVELKNQVENELGMKVRLQLLLEVMESGTVLGLAQAIAADNAGTLPATVGSDQ